ncbi:PucR family transcriptional regulator [Saccharopolyspora elongata]|uniref:PucR family transcriptional regulator n=1 Tax=Saccharopolyspora elongata TaxID=2530387 RepID=A0A4R4Z3X4_9PSEU|nr:PucR family transcriptional regulator [Saccharopolyspora elongata]TDD50762.1 PucR family transcriptional regulator [Saccharopolyspora elongata]
MNADSRAEGPSLTLRHLVDEPSLQLTAVEPGDLSAVVRSAHSTDLADAASRLRPRSIMLTTGGQFAAAPDDPVPQERLIADLVSADVAALLFGTGIHFDAVPRGLRNAARERNFPLLSVDSQIPFAAIEDFVNRGSLSAETYLLKRTVWLQTDLLHALSASDPVSALVIRLGALCKGAAVLYEGAGRIVASTGHGPLRLMWEEIGAQGPGPQRFEVGQWVVATRPFRVRGSGFQLAVASRNRALLNDISPELLETAERVLAAANASRSLVISQERAEAARLVSALRGGVTSSRVRETWDRLRAFGFRVGDDLRVVVASPVGAERPALVEALLEEAQVEDLALILSEDGDGDDRASGSLTAVLAERDTADAWFELLARTRVVGVSGPFQDLTVAPRYAQEAATAWHLAGRRHGRGSAATIVRLDEVDFATWLLTRRDDTQVADRLDRHFGELIRSPELVETVVLYLACDQDVKRTAELLFIHPNTVRYRLRKVEQLVGGQIASAKVVANLYLAFQDDILARIKPDPPG